MATYEITTPNGVYEIDAPDHASEAEVMAYAKKQLGKGVNRPNERVQQPTKLGKEALQEQISKEMLDAGPLARNYAAAGTGLSNLYEGIKQRLGAGNEDNIRANRTIANSAPLGATIGNVATYTPAAFIPGANTVLGGAVIGGLTGAAQPTLEGESAANNALVGMAGGMAFPAALRTGKAIKATAVDPFTTAGRDRMAGSVLNRVASDPKNVYANLLRAKGETPGFNPTTGQAASDAGIAALERTMRAIDPRAFDAIEKSQREALVNAVRGVAGDAEKRTAAVESRDSAAKALYGKAFQSDKMRRELAAEEAKAKTPFSGVGVDQTVPDLATPGLRQLAERPMFQQAIQEAKTLAANKGIRLNDPSSSIEGLHYIKLALDDMAAPGAMNAMGRNANAAVNDMRDRLAQEMSVISPTYGAARETFKDLSKPINQMDIGQALHEKLVPALYRDMESPPVLNAQVYAKALREGGDDLARNVTGMKGVSLEGTMTPEQMAALTGVSKDLQTMKNAELSGKGVGSDTIQKTAMSHVAAEAGIPNWMSSVARVPGGIIRDVGNAVYGNANKQVTERMAELLRNPEEAVAAMKAAGIEPSKALKLLANGMQGIGLSTAPTLQQLDF